MSAAWRRVVAASLWGVLLSAAGLHAQVVVDRILSRPGGEILTLSDVWQVIELRLVPLDAATVPAAQIALENRRLILLEISRVALEEPAPSDIALARQEWESRFGAAGVPEGAVADAGMTPAQLTAWLRDDARIQSYLDQRFAATPEADRGSAVDVWVNLLRQRAGLGGGSD